MRSSRATDRAVRVRAPAGGNCVVFLGKTLHSHSASLHPGVSMGTGKLNAGGRPCNELTSPPANLTLRSNHRISSGGGELETLHATETGSNADVAFPHQGKIVVLR